jgi:hypothetical protein
MPLGTDEGKAIIEYRHFGLQIIPFYIPTEIELLRQ